MSYRIQSASKLKEIMREYFQRMGKKENPVAWCTSVGPAELLRSFGFEVYFPENHGALLGATRTAGEHIPAAMKCGYSGDICSYTTGDIGAFLNKSTPLLKQYGLEGVPEPDLLVYNINQCREVEDWFTFYANHFNCPIAGIHPPRHLNTVGEAEVKLVAEQFRQIIPVCEQVSGQKFDLQKFKEVLKLSKEATLLWQQVLQTATSSPSPLSFFDGAIHMGPIVVLRGTQEAKDYYQILLSELQANIDTGIGFLNDESCRLFWEGMPIWGKLRSLADLFIQNSAAVVASTYCNSWIFNAFDEENPFESSALAYTEIFINRSETAKFEMLAEWVEAYQIDGMIFHDAKTCFNNSNARFGMPLKISKELGIPTLVVDGDLCDLRFFSEGQTMTKLETFIEQIQNQKVLV